MQNDKIAQILKPYRARIDALDDRIVDLMAERTAIIREVGVLKFNEGIEPVLQDRVEQVRERAAKRAGEKGMDEDFVRELYTLLIDYSCDLEEQIRQDLCAKKTARG